MKRFNNDTEILYQAIKDIKLSSGESIHDFLASNSSTLKINDLTNSMPLLTILVPDLSKFSPESWDVTSEIPVVCIRDHSRRKKEVFGYDYAGNRHTFLLNNVPKIPVIVVKDNERITVQDTKNARLSPDQKPAFKNEAFAFSYVDDSFDPTSIRKSTNSLRSGTSYFDPKSIDAYTNNLQYHRDYVYYGIAPELGTNTGTFDNTYEEHLTSIKFNYTSNNFFDGEIYYDWTEGSFDIRVVAITTGNGSSLAPVSKSFPVKFTDLFTYTISDNSVTLTGTKEYKLPYDGLKIAKWNMQSLGDRWLLKFFELDPVYSETLTINGSFSSTFGSNYSNNVKDGPNFGSNSSATSTFGSSYSITINNGDDSLEESFVYWTDKIVTNRTFHFPQLYYSFNTYEYTTGKITFSLEPKKVI